MMAVAFGTRFDLVTTATRVAHPERARLARAAAMARSAFGGITEFRKWAASHCDVARVLGARMGFSEQIQLALRHLWERWDGKGMPGELRGDQIPLAVRLMQVAQDADMAWHQGGSALADQVLAERAGAGSLWVGDRLLSPVAPVVPYPGYEAMPEEFHIAQDPFTALAVAAAVTETAVLGSSTINATQYQPANFARLLTSIDVASDGRFLPGGEERFTEELSRVVGPDVAIEMVHKDIALETTFAVRLQIPDRPASILERLKRRIGGAS